MCAGCCCGVGAVELLIEILNPDDVDYAYHRPIALLRRKAISWPCTRRDSHVRRRVIGAGAWRAGLELNLRSIELAATVAYRRLRCPQLEDTPPTAFWTPWTRKYPHRTPLQHVLDPGGVKIWPHVEALEEDGCWAAARTSLLQSRISHFYGPPALCRLPTVLYRSAPRPPVRLYPPRMKTSQPESLLMSTALPRRQQRPARGWSVRSAMMRWCVVYRVDGSDFAANRDTR